MVRAYDKNNREYALGKPTSSSDHLSGGYDKSIPVSSSY